jgi:hypothetical protein
MKRLSTLAILALVAVAGIAIAFVAAWRAGQSTDSARPSAPGAPVVPGGPDTRVVVIDALRGSFDIQSELLAAYPAQGRVEELVSAEELRGCFGGRAPGLAPDGRSLYVTCDPVSGDDAGGSAGGAGSAGRLMRIDSLSGAMNALPLAADGGGQIWDSVSTFGITGFSDEGRLAYLGLYFPDSQPKLAAYDLEAEMLLAAPMMDLIGWEAHPSADGRRLYVCCWVQSDEDASYPHPGVTTLSAADGQVLAEVMVDGSPADTFTTHVVPAGDGRHFYALRATSGQWWELDADAGAVTASGRLAAADAGPSNPSRAAARRLLAAFQPATALASGPEEVVAGDVAGDPGRRLYSGLYVADGRREDGPARSGGGIAVIALPEFAIVDRLATDGTWESLALSVDGRWLYALDSQRAELRMFDTATLEEVARLEHVGQWPTEVLVPVDRVD